MKFVNILAAAFVVSSAGAFAQAPAPGIEGATPRSGASMTEGEVRKVDKEQGKVTLRHGPIQNLQMPGMTMVFRVADPQMLDMLKEGDKVRFSAEKVNGAITVTAIEPAAR